MPSASSVLSKTATACAVAAGVYAIYGSPSEEKKEPAWFFDYIVLWLTLFMYAVGLAYYFGYARRRLATAAPEELAARAATDATMPREP